MTISRIRYVIVKYDVYIYIDVDYVYMYKSVDIFNMFLRDPERMRLEFARINWIKCLGVSSMDRCLPCVFPVASPHNDESVKNKRPLKEKIYIYIGNIFPVPVMFFLLFFFFLGGGRGCIRLFVWIYVLEVGTGGGRFRYPGSWNGQAWIRNLVVLVCFSKVCRKNTKLGGGLVLPSMLSNHLGCIKSCK